MRLVGKSIEREEEEIQKRKLILGDSLRSLIIWIFREPWTYTRYAIQCSSIWHFETISARRIFPDNVE